MDLDYLQALTGGLAEEETGLAAYRHIWVVAEHREGRLLRVTKELLGRSRELAERLGARVEVALLGDRVEALAEQLISFGADRVHLAEHPLLATYTAETYTKALAALIQEKKPEMLLLGATANGNDLAPRLAQRLATGLTTDCVAIDIDESERLLLSTRPLYGGTLLATMACPQHRPQMATVRPGVLRAMPADPSREGAVERAEVSLDDGDLRVKPRRVVDEFPRPADLQEAQVIVAGGRGLGTAEGFNLLEELARVLNGSVAASRAAVEAGWATRDRQVGITGNLVRPRVYFACGISGSIQHLMGMRGSKYIVAVNSNPDAAIFKFADYGIAGDLYQIIPALTDELKAAGVGSLT
jgi:electron transfer flavoprotein alpha subunit